MSKRKTVKTRTPPARRLPGSSDDDKAEKKGDISHEPPSRSASLARIVRNSLSGDDEDENVNDEMEEAGGEGQRSMSIDEFMRASSMVEKNLKELDEGLRRAMRDRSDDLTEILAGFRESHAASVNSTVHRHNMSQETLTHVYSLRARSEADNDLEGIGEMVDEDGGSDEGGEEDAKKKKKKKEPKEPKEPPKPRKKTTTTTTKAAARAAAAKEEIDEEAAIKSSSPAATSAGSAAPASSPTPPPPPPPPQEAAALSNPIFSNAERTVLVKRVEELEAEVAAKDQEKAEIVEAMTKEKARADAQHDELQKELALAQTIIKQTLQQVWDLQAKQAKQQRGAGGGERQSVVL
jgi:hypothetical protein